jgi:plastocyanin
MTVKAGATITVTNKDTVAHTLTDKATHKFDTGNIPANGGTGTFTAPTTPGTYKFGCTYHPNMAGTLIVTS